MVEPASEAKVPAVHWEQLPRLVAASKLEKKPTGQESQRLALVSAANCPGGQGVQRRDPAEEEKVPGAHATHVAGLEAPVEEENFPAVQFRQADGEDWVVLGL